MLGDQLEPKLLTLISRVHPFGGTHVTRLHWPAVPAPCPRLSGRPVSRFSPLPGWTHLDFAHQPDIWESIAQHSTSSQYLFCNPKRKVGQVHLISVDVKLQGWLHVHPRKMASDKKEILGFDGKSIWHFAWNPIVFGIKPNSKKRCQSLATSLVGRQFLGLLDFDFCLEFF